MTKIELKETNHSYYCSDSNYYVGGNKNFGQCELETWDEFKQSWGYDANGRFCMDFDYNLLFRWDIKEKYEQDVENGTKEYSLYLYFIHQRKGNFVPVVIYNLKQEDMEEVSKFLNDAWIAMQELWFEMNEGE